MSGRWIEYSLFSEAWHLGAYTYSAVGIFDGSGLTPERLRADVELFYQEARARRRHKWPRGIARFILVPTYTAASFPDATLSWLKDHKLGRWAIMVKPVLYNARTHDCDFKEAVQNDTLLFYPKLSALFAQGIALAEQHGGDLCAPQVHV